MLTHLHQAVGSVLAYAPEPSGTPGTDTDITPTTFDVNSVVTTILIWIVVPAVMFIGIGIVVRASGGNWSKVMVTVAILLVGLVIIGGATALIGLGPTISHKILK